MLEAVMCCAKRDGQGAYTNAKWEEVNFKLDSPQSESDRGESQVKIERAKWWLHIALPAPSREEKFDIHYISPSLSVHYIYLPSEFSVAVCV